MGLREKIELERKKYKLRDKIYNVIDKNTGERFRIEEYGTWRGLIPEHRDQFHFEREFQKQTKNDKVSEHHYQRNWNLR